MTYSKIKRIKKLNRIEHCYDIQVEDNQRYFSNGILSHNSTIFDAICFALFGRIPKDLKLEQMVNENNDGGTRVELGLEVNGTEYFIVRYQAHPKYDNSLLLYKDKRDEDHLISKANKTDSQNLIIDLIKLNYKSFINAVMMSLENVGGFLQDDNKKKKEVIENILQLTIITKYYLISVLKRKEVKKQLTSISLEIKNVIRLIDNVKISMADYVISCKKQKKENTTRLENLKQELQKLDNLDLQKEKDLIRKAESLALEMENGMILYQQYVDKIQSFNNELETYESSLLEYNTLIDSNISLRDLAKIEIDNIKNKIKFINDKIQYVQENPDTCPVCKNNINEKELKEYITENKEKIDEYQITLNDRSKHYENLKNQIDSWTEKQNSLTESINGIKEKIEKEQKKANEIKNNYEAIIIPETMNENELNKLSEKIEKIKLDIKTIGGKDSIDKDYLNTLTNQAKNLKDELKDKKKEEKELTKKFFIYQWWEDSLSSKKNSLKSWCVNNILGYFNTKIKFYMDKFFDGLVNIELDNELNEKISFVKNERDFKQFSGGEKRRLNLAILFALNALVKTNISTKINIMFLDEILSTNLDDKGIAVLLELLEEMKTKKETVYIIDHKANFKDYPSFESILVEKDKNGFSTIKIL